MRKGVWYITLTAVSCKLSTRLCAMHKHTSMLRGTCDTGVINEKRVYRVITCKHEELLRHPFVRLVLRAALANPASRHMQCRVRKYVYSKDNQQLLQVDDWRLSSPKSIVCLLTAEPPLKLHIINRFP